MGLVQVHSSAGVSAVNGGGSGRLGSRRVNGRCCDMGMMRSEVADKAAGGGEKEGRQGHDNEPVMQLQRKLWAETDALFESTIGPEALLERPIALRNPFLFCTFGGGGEQHGLARDAGDQRGVLPLAETLPLHV